jgi:hypothetical protein
MSTKRKGKWGFNGRGHNGFRLCFCGCGQEVTMERRTSLPGHYDKWAKIHHPPTVRRLVWERDKGICAGCRKICYNSGRDWQADHILPVCEGGGECGLENYRTLCTDCHKKETAALARRRADARRISQDCTTIQATLFPLAPAPRVPTQDDFDLSAN